MEDPTQSESIKDKENVDDGTTAQTSPKSNCMAAFPLISNAETFLNLPTFSNMEAIWRANLNVVTVEAKKREELFDNESVTEKKKDDKDAMETKKKEDKTALKIKKDDETTTEIKKEGNNDPEDKPKGGKSHSKRGKKKKMASKTVTVGIFVCSSESCGNVWKTRYGWIFRTPQNCDICEGRAKRISVVDEICELDPYNCPTEGCENFWKNIHCNEITEDMCDMCKVHVNKETQSQLWFGKHFFYKCRSEQCGIEWEDFYYGHEQKCQKCGNAGHCESVEKVAVMGAEAAETSLEEEITISTSVKPSKAKADGDAVK